MSKLSEKLEAVQTGRRLLEDDGFSIMAITSDVHTDDVMLTTMMQEYRCSVTLSMRGFCRDLEELETLKKLVRQAITNEVFGEFRDDIMVIYQALYERKTHNAIEALSILEKKMFS